MRLSKNYTIYLILFYIWLLIVGPQQRFDFLGAFHFEKIVMFFAWLTLFLSGRIKLRFNSISALIIVFYLWLLLSYFLSPYSSYYLAQHWIENYWKLFVLYFLILFSVQDSDDLLLIIKGFIVILFVYQAHSWFDFLRGGSYVYQQGIRRIIGVWSTGIGSANYFGMITLFSFPFALLWHRINNERKVQYFLYFYFFLTFFSIIYSGTRGALIGVLFFIIINMRKLKHIIASMVILTILISVTYLALPDYLKYRYFSLFVENKYDFVIDEEADEIQRESAQSRFEGLVDGWHLALEKPIFGYGPGTSAHARKLVNQDLMYSTESDLQTHNLYGQLLAETGFVGILIFFLIIGIYLSKLKFPHFYLEEHSFHYQFSIALQNFILLLLFYGMASHILFRYYWFFLFGLHGAFIEILSIEKAKYSK